jgi:hypothetical protein
MKNRIRHTVGAGIVAAGVTLALACTASTSPLELAGTYSLFTVNGSPLPYALAGTGGTKVELLGDSFTLNPSGTYSEAGYKRFTTGGVVTFTYPIDAGNFTRRDDDITLASLLFPSRSGTISNGVFTVADGSLTLVYRR